MLVCKRITLLVVLLVVAGGCERARRYPPAAMPATAKTLDPAVGSTIKDTSKSPVVPPYYGWIDAPHRIDVVIQFISEDNQPREWNTLKEYWNEALSPVEVLVAVLGLPPLESAVALRTQLGLEHIKIKVPRGLPDPTPHVPSANPPTLGKWILGRRLFFDNQLLRMSPTLTRSCADCHDPTSAFALHVDKPASGKRNVPSLLNSIYNRHQFWDGRVESLEQVLLRQLDDEREAEQEQSLENSPGYLHVWPGLVKRVGGRPHYLRAFDLVYGTDPTADNIAKALATYMRTLLSGNSLIDQATQQCRERGGKALEVHDFEALLSDRQREHLATPLTTKEAATELVRGHELFHGKARCNVCHPGPLFTDHSFHNIGIGESVNFPSPGKEPGRFAFVPFGLKDRQLIGAFKTPSLRNVSRTGPYMHDGSIVNLLEVVKYFNDGIKADAAGYLDPELTAELGQAQRLNLTVRDLSALALYLHALDGESLPSRFTEISNR
jgi:cytochrome c peroxidase